MRIDFYLRFQTRFGQELSISGNSPALGNGAPGGALPMAFFNEDFWHISVDVDPADTPVLHYSYRFDQVGGRTKGEGTQRQVELKGNGPLLVVDTWNDEGFIENVFTTAPFRGVFSKGGKNAKFKKVPAATHLFKVKAPLLGPDETVCILGSDPALQQWDMDRPVLLQKEDDWYAAGVNLDSLPVTYKYGVYNTKHGRFVRFEEGDNRTLYPLGEAAQTTLVHDGFVRLPNTVWKSAGVAIPVFSLRSANSFGIGEFLDIKLLADWAAEAGMKLIQLLPVNDTSATFSWKDSYPYAAISAFALHPIYINLQKVAGKKNAAFIKPLLKKQKSLNSLAEIDYEEVITYKMNVLRELYDLQGNTFMEEADYHSFFAENKYWLVPYAAFCYLRDKYNTSDFSKWKSHSTYEQAEIDRLSSRKSKAFPKITFYYFLQYHLHLQLKEATDYAHKKGLAVKGDIPIGIYRYGCDAWMAPELYNMDMQAGAPPDDFAVKGQNWGFPTYNWKKMAEDNFEWWRQRFHQMSHYFDAFRIDHILGFFRIWSIPIDGVEGILGRFVPALPVHVHEFGERSIWFDYDRYCKPYIPDHLVNQLFGARAEEVKETFLHPNIHGRFDLREGFTTQREVEAYFAGLEQSEENERIKIGLYDLITNVILFEHPGSDRQQFHFRISIEHLSSFQELDPGVKHNVYELYINYFYRRQDAFWEEEAMHKLPHLKAATNMLICGEDLGMVPHCVPAVMQQLGILSLEIQRMPKNPRLEFFHPKDAPYMSVITPSTHDMSTIRGWWEESREKTQQFYNSVLGESGTAPYFCEPWINRAIVLQHLYSPAMWSIFQLQDLLGMSDTLRRENPNDERINVPANPTHYWNYRMHLPLEQLLKEKEFNRELREYITNSGRA